jgi:sugar-specific transcriptional regulator TrmB
MFNDIVVGIGRASPLILDNLGITVKIGEANEKYAESLGKASKELTVAEKKQALLNAVLDQGASIMERVGEAGQMITAAERLQRFQAALDNLMVEIGQTFLPLFTEISEGLTELVQDATDFIQDHQEEITNLITNLPDVFKATFELITSIIQEAFKWETFKAVMDELFQFMIKAFIALGKNIGSVLIKAIFASIELIFKNIALLRTRIEAALPFGGPARQILKEMEKDYAKTFDNIGKEAFKSVGQAIQDLADLGEGGIKNIESISNKFDNIIDSYKNRITNFMESSIDDVKKFSDRLGEALEIIPETVEEATGELRRNLEAAGVGVRRRAGGVAGRGGPGRAGVGEGTLGQSLLDFARKIENVNALMDWQQTILSSLLETIAPVVNEVLEPLVGALKQVGKLMGLVLLPLIEGLAPIINELSKAFIWLYNNILINFAKAFVAVGNIIANIGIVIYDIFAVVVNFFSELFTGAKAMTVLELRDISEGIRDVKPITLEEIRGAGAAEEEQETNIYGGSVSVQQAPTIHIFQYFQGPVIGKIISERVE